MTGPSSTLRITSPSGLSQAQLAELTVAALAQLSPAERRFLVIVPDATRKLPLARLFGAIWDALRGQAQRVDAIIAQGTHPPMSAAAKRRWVFAGRAYPKTDIFDHEWDNPASLAVIGTLPLADQLRRFGEQRVCAPLLGFNRDLDIRVNQRLLEYDRLILLTRVQPHEVAGYAGGAKQVFPGVSGSEMTSLLHAVGSLHTNRGIHGVLPNPVRDLIDALATHLPTPLTTLNLVIDDADSSIRGFYIQPNGWRECTVEAARLSAELNIRYLPRRVTRVVAALPQRPDGSWVYPDLWTGAKGMLKTEDAVADGGELVIWAPNIRDVSGAHGEFIRRIGYHTYAYFFARPDRWRGVTPLALNGSALLKGEGRLENGVEMPRIDVRLATAIPPGECRALNIGYEDPVAVSREIDAAPPDQVHGSRLVIHNAGSALWRYRPVA